MRRIVLITVLAAGTIAASTFFWITTGNETDDFETALAATPGCKADKDCTVIFTPCPLGCAHAVIASDAERLRLLADSLAERYTAKHGACAYDCTDPGPAICVKGRCELARDTK